MEEGTRPSPVLANETAGRTRLVVLHLAWLLPVLIIQMWFFRTHFRGLRAAEAMDAAQVGRHISEGHGFTTSFLRPLSIAIVGKVNGHPDLYNAPLQPLLLSIAFNLGTSSDRVVAALATLFGLLTAFMAYLLGARLLDWRAGALAAVVVSMSAGLLQSNISGTNTTLLAFLIGLLFYLVLTHRGTLRRSMVCGGISGLACLTEYVALMLALPVAGLLFLPSRPARARHVGLFVAGLVIVVLPWLIRNQIVAGSPFATLKSYSIAMYGDSYPSTSLYRLPSRDGIAPLTFVSGHPSEVAKKLLVNLASLQSSLPGTYGLVLFALFAMSLFLDLGSTAANRMKWGVAIGIALMAAGAAIGEPRLDPIYALLGPIAALGTTAFFVALEARGLSRSMVSAATAGVLALAALPWVLSALPTSADDRPESRSLDYLSRSLPPGAVVLTDKPWAVAWHSDRIAVWLPQAPAPDIRPGSKLLLREAADATEAAGFRALERAGVRPDAIFLSSELPSYPAFEDLGRWQLLHRVIAAQLETPQRGETEGPVWVPKGWTLAASLPPMDFVLTRSRQAGPAAGMRPEGRP